MPSIKKHALFLFQLHCYGFHAHYKAIGKALLMIGHVCVSCTDTHLSLTKKIWSKNNTTCLLFLLLP